MANTFCPHSRSQPFLFRRSTLIQISAHSSPRLASSNNSTAFAGSCPASFSSRYTNGYRSLMSATVDAHSCLSLVALITRRDLLFCAKHLFVAAIGRARAYMAGELKSAS